MRLYETCSCASAFAHTLDRCVMSTFIPTLGMPEPAAAAR
jgi:hypothetical protein